jgi:PAS domain S-box-containing protein
MGTEPVIGSEFGSEAELEETLRKSGGLEIGRIATIVISGEGLVHSANEQAGWMFGKDSFRLTGTWIQELGMDNVRGVPLFGDITNYLDTSFGYSEWERDYAPPGEDALSLRLRAIQRDDHWLLLIEDITSQRLLESRFKAILGTSRDGILVIDENGLVSWPNSRFGYFFGLNWRQFKGLHYRAVVELIRDTFAVPASFMDLVHRIEKDPEAHAEAVLRLEFPRSMTVQIFTRPVSSAGGHTVGRVWFVSDVTAFKEMESQLKAVNQDLERRVRERTQQLEAQNRELERARRVLERMNSSFESELDMAKQVQQGILPKSLPDLPGWDVAAECLPTGKVGGDFYDVVRLNEDEIFVLVADVSGHGVSSALVTAMAKMAFQRYLEPGRFTSLPEILEKVNEQLRSVIRTDHYLTAFAAHITLSTGRMRYCRVCHPYPYVVRGNGEVETLSGRGGYFLGMFDNTQYVEGETFLAPGDFLLVYTDGLNESFDPDGQQYGRARLETVVRSWASQGAWEALGGILSDRDAHARGRLPNDDITLITLRRLPEAAESP